MGAILAGTPRGVLASLWKCMCEFIGTFILVLSVGLNVVLAATLLSLVYFLGNLFGAMFNPALVVQSWRAAWTSAYLLTPLCLSPSCSWVASCSTPRSTFRARRRTLPLDLHLEQATISSGMHSRGVFTFLLRYTVLSVAAA